MKTRFSDLLVAIVCPALIAFATSAAGHGDAKHAKKPSVTKEQKAWGIAGNPSHVQRVIEIRMTDDMRFIPDRIGVKRGDTVRFVLRNSGKMMHEMVIGTQKDLDEHAALMLKFPGMEHDEPYMAHVAPGKQGEILWNFNRSGDFQFACLIAGHYQAGMKGTITVAPK